MYERLDKSYIQELLELKDLRDTTKLVQELLPKQTDIDKILDIIKRKVLKGTHLPLTIKEIQASYLTIPLFQRPILIFSTRHELPSKRSAIRKVETLAERFNPLDSLLFKLVTTPERETVSISSIGDMHRQNYNTVQHQSLCRTSRCYKDVPHNQ